MSTPSGRQFQDINAIRAAAQATRQQPIVRAPEPPRERAPSRRNGEPPSPRLARVTFVVLFVASTAAMVIDYVPEIAFAPEVFGGLRAQLSPLAWVPGQGGFGGFLMLLGLIAAWVISTRRVADDFAWIPIGVVLLALAVGSGVGVADYGWQGVGMGIAVAVCLAIATVAAGRKLVSCQAVSTPPTVPVGVIVAFIATFLPALALGRALFGRALSDLIVVWDPRAWTLGNISTLWLWLGGGLVAVLVGVAVSFVPFTRGQKIVPRVVTAILVVAALVIYVVPTASASAAEQASALRTDRATDRLSSYCSAWTRTTEGSAPAATVFNGSSCATVGVYSGSILTHSTQLDYDLSEGAWFGPSDGSVSVTSLVSALYGDVIAVAAVQNSTGTPGVVGIGFGTGAVLWERWCPAGTGTPGVRFAGSGNDSAEALRVTLPGEGEGIFLTCDGNVELFSAAGE